MKLVIAAFAAFAVSGVASAQWAEPMQPYQQQQPIVLNGQAAGNISETPAQIQQRQQMDARQRSFDQQNAARQQQYRQSAPVTYQQIGNMTYGSNGTVCQQVGNMVYCN